jgi:hypothetical protein
MVIVYLTRSRPVDTSPSDRLAVRVDDITAIGVERSIRPS